MRFASGGVSGAPNYQFGEPLPTVFIHPMACVHDDAQIGEGTKVWQFASVIRGSSIGFGCSIGACSVVDGSTMGSRCSIGHGAQIHPGTVMEDDVFVGPGAIVCNDLWPSTDKDGFVIPCEAKPIVFIDDKASIGAGAIILPGVRLYPSAFVAAGAVVDRDVGEGMIFRRCGTITRVPIDWRERRMRYAFGGE